MELPEDPYMLLSFINMKLRDGDYEDLADLCNVLSVDEETLKQRLGAAGFEYNPTLRQFR